MHCERTYQVSSTASWFVLYCNGAIHKYHQKLEHCTHGCGCAAARNSREAAVGVNALGSALQQTLQQGSAAMGQGAAIPPQTAQMLAGFIASEVVPLVKAELAGALGPWLAESNAALKRLDTRMAVSASCTVAVCLSALVAG